MGPISAESVPRHFTPLIGAFIASAVAFVALRPEPPPAPTVRSYEHYERVGKCVDGDYR